MIPRRRRFPQQPIKQPVIYARDTDGRIRLPTAGELHLNVGDTFVSVAAGGGVGRSAKSVAGGNGSHIWFNRDMEIVRV